MVISLERKKFNVTSKDRILDNGACYQLITQTYFENWCFIHPLMSKTLFNKMLKQGKLVLSKDKLHGFNLYEFVDTEKEGE